MSRVEQIGDCTIYQADYREVIQSVDASLVCTDPPYGMSHPCNFSSRGRSVLAECTDWPDVEGDAEPFDPSLILSLNIPTILWGANWYADKLPPVSGWLVWDKLRPDALDQATCELAWTNCIKGVRRFAHLWHGMMRASERGESYHPTQKPVALFDWILSLPWIPDGTVFDPFMGSGPCGVACVKAGRPYIGCETELMHFDTACRRIEAATRLSKCNLFKDEPATSKQAELFA